MPGGGHFFALPRIDPFPVFSTLLFYLSPPDCIGFEKDKKTLGQFFVPLRLGGF
jgi:hypothetical protein